MHRNGINTFPENGNGLARNNGNGPRRTTAHDTRKTNGIASHDQSDILVRETADAPVSTDSRTQEFIAMGDDHVPGAIDTPLREDAFALTDAQKITVIESHFTEIMRTLGLDLRDDSLRGTPHRVAKMFVREIFSGLDPANKPSATVFDNAFKYGEMLIEKNVSLHTTCEHHFLPIVGRAHVAYISSGTVIGLSKINRIVDYFARRPQVQERLTVQIAEELARVLHTEDVAVIIDAKHFCVAARGIQDTHSSTVTAEYRGRFAEAPTRKELLSLLNLSATA
jgi:GTP cyclohydrolase I